MTEDVCLHFWENFSCLSNFGKMKAVCWHVSCLFTMSMLDLGHMPDNLMLSSVVSSPFDATLVIGLELVCKALTKDLAVFNRNKNRSCWNTRCIKVPCSRSRVLCSTNNLVFLGIFSLSEAWNKPFYYQFWAHAATIDLWHATIEKC